MINVGNVVYLLDKKTHTIVPCKVIEKINSISLAGEKTSHIIQSPSKKELTLENYKNPWFTDLTDARNFLLESAAALIDATISDTISSQEKNFPESLDKETLADVASLGQVVSPKDIDKPFDSEKKVAESLVVDLGDGTTAKVQMPNGF